MRKLASIQRIAKLEPIEGADRIEKATVLGWECVVGKGDFKVGDLCVYFEIDSILPAHEVFDFMASRKYRVKTIRLKQQISQGLVMPIDIMWEFGFNKITNFHEGDDVTKSIGVVKYDPELQKEMKLRKLQKRNPVIEYMLSFPWFRRIWFYFGATRTRDFPTFIPKTDETRIQNMPQVIRQRADIVHYYSEKIDGTSSSFAIYKEKWLRRFFVNDYFVCSRNIALHKKDNSVYWKIAIQEKIEEKLRKVGKNIAIQGEIIGEGIQGNKYKLIGIHLYLFNVYDIDKQKYYSLSRKIEFCNEFNFKLVPIINHGFTWVKDVGVNYFVDMSKGNSIINPKVKREGIVIRDQYDDTKSFKVINPEFLLKYE